MPPSSFPLTLLVTRGRPLFPGARLPPVLVRLLPVAEDRPLIFDCRRGGTVFLLGLDPEVSLDLTAVPFLKLVAGGSGRGRCAPEGVVATVLVLLMGDSFRAAMRGRGAEAF